jgi:hypothetical protein
MVVRMYLFVCASKKIYKFRYLIRIDSSMIQEQDRMRAFIIQYSQGIITAKDSIFFWYNKKFIDSNLRVKDFLKYNFKDLENDGWLHLKVTTQ